MAEPGSTDGRRARRPRAGRPERPLDPRDGLLARFAHELRQLRAAAGYPSYRALARTALFSASVLSTAASGTAFPSLQVTLAYAGACGGDTAEWRRRWEATAAELARSRRPSAGAQAGHARHQPRSGYFSHSGYLGHLGRIGHLGRRTARPARPAMGRH